MPNKSKPKWGNWTKPESSPHPQKSTSKNFWNKAFPNHTQNSASSNQPTDRSKDMWDETLPKLWRTRGDR